MERRNFLVSAMLVAGTIKAALANKKKPIQKIGKNEFLIPENNDYIYLKRNEIYHLPEDPKSLLSLLTFDAKKYRFGKSPEIKLNGKRINGELKDSLILTKDIQLNGRTQFVMQYVGEEIGWILLV